MLDFRVATFLSVCETLNYTRTAERLSISQPAVSQHIAQLERQLGAKLFERRGKRLELTAAGRAARAVAETMAHDEHLLKEEVRSQSHDEAPLVVGATLSAGEYLVSEPLARYLAARPNARVDVVQGDTQRLIAQLRAGAIDCAFVEGVFDSAAFAARTFARQKLVGVCAPGAAVARRFDGSVTSLLGERLIAREPGSGTRAVLEQALAAHNLAVESFARTIEVSSINIIKALVAGDAGIAFLYEAAIARDVEAGRLALINPDEPLAEHDIAFIYLKNSAFADRLDRFFDDLSR